MTREDWLREMIKERYKSLYGFSRQVQMPHSTLRRILAPGGVEAASLGNLEKICRGLGLSLSDLAGTMQPAGPVPLLLTDEHEIEVMRAYRERSDLQPVVDRVLEV